MVSYSEGGELVIWNLDQGKVIKRTTFTTGAFN